MSGTEGKPQAGAGALSRADTKPPDFKEDPTGVYEYLKKAYKELIGYHDRELNKALSSMVAGQRAKDGEE